LTVTTVIGPVHSLSPWGRSWGLACRLSYPRAEHLFKTASAELDPHGDGWTLHQLRHSALTHLAAAGRTAPELQAKPRHQHLSSLGRYIRLGEETSARITAAHDPANRRRTRR
jgi:integrase